MKHSPIPPKGCTCGSLWTVRGRHGKIDCPYVEPDSPFMREFKKLKSLRNNHHMDEPEFDEKVEQLAANLYAHRTAAGWCCACDADIAFAEAWLRDTKPELFK